MTATNFARILKDIWDEKAYLMLNTNPCQYLPFKQIVENVLDDFNLHNGLQQLFLDETSLANVIIDTITQYLEPEAEFREIIQAITSQGFFETLEKRKADLVEDNTDDMSIRHTSGQRVN